MTAIVTADRFVSTLAQRVNAGADATVSGPNKALKDAMVAKKFFADVGGGGPTTPTTTPTLDAVVTAGSTTDKAVTLTGGLLSAKDIKITGGMTVGGEVQPTYRATFRGNSTYDATVFIHAPTIHPTLQTTLMTLQCYHNSVNLVRFIRAPDGTDGLVPGAQVGTITTNGSSTSYNTTSDYRLKTNITGITDGVTRVKQLAPCKFNWITGNTTDQVDGFIAHEVAAVVPDAVTGQKDAVNHDGTANLQSIDHSKLVPVLTAAVKELIARVEQLETLLSART